MTASRLRVYFGPEREATATAVTALKPAHDTVTVPLGEVLPLLVDALKAEECGSKTSMTTT